MAVYKSVPFLTQNIVNVEYGCRCWQIRTASPDLVPDKALVDSVVAEEFPERCG